MKVPKGIVPPPRRGPWTTRKSGAGPHTNTRPRGTVKRAAIREAAA